jgi:2-iminobutanoate/2-iminopropanoate deaminase
MNHIVKCSIFLKNMDDFSAVNAIYASYFSENPPARETVQVSKLPLDVPIEISCIAVAD